MTVADEGRELARAKAAEIAALPWEELDAYGTRDDSAQGPSGRRFRLQTHVFWDTEEWASGLYIITLPRPGMAAMVALEGRTGTRRAGRSCANAPAHGLGAHSPPRVGTAPPTARCRGYRGNARVSVTDVC
jgi:hypothetical protein